MTQLSTVWRLSYWALVLATLWLSLIPVEQVPKSFHFWDKAQHALGFAGLAFLGLMAHIGRIPLLMFGLVLFGGAIEFAQHWTGWRHGDWLDWVADCVGLVLGGAAWRLGRLLVKTRT